MVAVLQLIAVIVPVKGGVDPPLSVNVLFVGELGNTEQSGKLLADPWPRWWARRS